MTARHIAARLVRRHGFRTAANAVIGRYHRHVGRLQDARGVDERAAARVTLWAAVHAALFQQTAVEA